MCWMGSFSRNGCRSFLFKATQSLELDYSLQTWTSFWLSDLGSVFFSLFDKLCNSQARYHMRTSLSSLCEREPLSLVCVRERELQGPQREISSLPLHAGLSPVLPVCYAHPLSFPRFEGSAMAWTWVPRPA